MVKTPRSAAYQAKRVGQGPRGTAQPLPQRRWLFPLDAYRLAARAHRRLGADLVVAQDPFATGLAGYWLKKRHGVPLCIQVHNDMIGCEWWMRESRANRLMEPLGAWLVRQADTVQVVSDTIRGRLAERGMDPGRAWNIMTGAGIDAGQFQAADGAEVRSRLLGGRHRKLVLFMGRLVKQKDLPTLLKAAEIVARKRPDTLFLLVGDGEEKTALQEVQASAGPGGQCGIHPGGGPERGPCLLRRL